MIIFEETVSQQTPIDYSEPMGVHADKKKGRAQEIDLHIGERLKELRKQRKMTQNDLADTLNISFQQIQKYEKGKSRISFAQIIELSQYMGLPLSAFTQSVANMGLADSAEQQDISYQAPENEELQELIDIYNSFETVTQKSDFLKLAKTLADNIKN